MLLDFYRKTKWFIKNYNEISYGKRILNNNDLLLPQVFLGPITYCTDSLITSNNADFIKEPKFAKAYKAAAATNPWEGFTLQWRVYIVCWFANYVKDLEGDFVECGVNTGAYASAIIDYINFAETKKCFFLLDTFDGFPEAQLTKDEVNIGNEYYGGDHYKDVYEQVKETFEPFNVRIIKGIVPNSLKDCTANKIAYLSIDMNAEIPEIAAANYFWERIVKGGVIILDDYGFPPHISQKIAFDKFAVEKGVEILSLPTGQGIIFKP